MDQYEPTANHAQGCALLLAPLSQVSEALPQSLSAAAAAQAAASSAIADNASATTSTHRPPADNTAVWTPHSLGSANSHSSRDAANAFNTDSVHNTAAAAAATQPGVQDKLRWWGDIAKQAYEAIDGCLQGFEDAIEDKTPDVTSHMSPSEAEMVKVSGGRLYVGFCSIVCVCVGGGRGAWGRGGAGHDSSCIHAGPGNG